MCCTQKLYPRHVFPCEMFFLFFPNHVLQIIQKRVCLILMLFVCEIIFNPSSFILCITGMFLIMMLFVCRIIVFVTTMESYSLSLYIGIKIWKPFWSNMRKQCLSDTVWVTALWRTQGWDIPPSPPSQSRRFQLRWFQLLPRSLRATATGSSTTITWIDFRGHMKKMLFRWTYKDDLVLGGSFCLCLQGNMLCHRLRAFRWDVLLYSSFLFMKLSLTHTHTQTNTHTHTHTPQMFWLL